MSKTVVCGDAIVVKSSMKLEELRTISRFRPEALMLYDEDKKPIFGVGVSTGCGDINEYGMTFGSESHDEDKLATITMCGRNIAGDVKDYIADNFGGAIANLNKLEETLPTVLEEIKAAKQAVVDSITVQ